MTGERFTTPDDLWYVEDDALYDVRNRSQWGSVSGPGALAAAVKYGAHKALADRDTALGRLRSVKHPDWVVYPDWQGPDVVSVLDELSAIQNTYRRGDPITSRVGSAIAAEYFAAHPVAEPKPWEDARDKEIWVLTIANSFGGPEPYRAGVWGLRLASVSDH